MRNPAWKASSDPIRKAYVDKIVVTETGNQTDHPAAAADQHRGRVDGVRLVPAGRGGARARAQMQSGLNHNFNLGPTYSTSPYLVFNEVSPNNDSALAKVAVRQALSYGINRSHLITRRRRPDDQPAADAHPAARHQRRPGPALRVRPVPVQRVQGQADAGGRRVPERAEPDHAAQPAVLDRAPSCPRPSQSDLAKIGVKVKLLACRARTCYAKYLTVPSVAKRGVWDLALSGWGPDWYGDAALSYFSPLFSGPPVLPAGGQQLRVLQQPLGEQPDRAGRQAATASAAAAIWAQADQAVMKDAPIYPIAAPLQPLYHASYVHNAVYVPAIQQFDPTNVWMSSPGDGQPARRSRQAPAVPTGAPGVGLQQGAVLAAETVRPPG